LVATFSAVIGVSYNGDAGVRAAAELSVAGFAAAVATSGGVLRTVAFAFALVAFLQAAVASVVALTAVFGVEVEIHTFVATQCLLWRTLAFASHAGERVLAGRAASSTVVLAGLEIHTGFVATGLGTLA
jgi:hypothetical protein